LHWPLSLGAVDLVKSLSPLPQLSMTNIMLSIPLGRLHAPNLQQNYILTSIYVYSISFRALRDSSHSASFRIPWTKTTWEEGGSVILTGRSDYFAHVMLYATISLSTKCPRPRINFCLSNNHWRLGAHG
jgi:hypothetical protein